MYVRYCRVMIQFPETTGRPLPTPDDYSVLRTHPSQQHRKVTLDERQDNGDGSITVSALGSQAGSAPSLLQLGPAHLAALRATQAEEDSELPVTDDLSRMLVLTGQPPRRLRILESAADVAGGGLHLRFVSGPGKSPADVYLCADDLEFLLDDE